VTLFWNCWLTGGACHDRQLASRSYCQRDGCRRVHICYCPDHWDYSASTTTLRGRSFTSAVDRKPVLVERDNRRRTRVRGKGEVGVTVPDYVAIGVLTVLIVWAVADWIPRRKL
jgi:hypothetical protein